METRRHFLCHLILNPTIRKTLIMEITIKKQHEQTIHIPVPCFWKSTYRYVGLIDESTLVTFANYGSICEVTNYKFPESGMAWLEATQTDENFAIATEEDFFEAYDEAMKSITITPILKTW
jgi:hypothetical protein